jgi:nitrite reductase (NADH) large subunit
MIQAAKYLRKKIAELGVGIHTERNTVEISDGETCRHVMKFSDGTSLETDMILFSAGIRPRDDIARASGITVGARGGIVVDNFCRTNHPDIYAIGECALWDGKIYGLVAPGYQMADVACSHLLGAEDKQFFGADMSTKLKLMGVDVASIGDAHGTTAGSINYSYIDERNQTYKKLVVSADGKKLLGAVLVGDVDAYGDLLQLKLNDMTLPEKPEALILPATDGSKPVGLGVDALPMSAVICSCNNVTKQDLCTAIESGVMELGELKSCTKAATSCGGCSALVGQVLKCELQKRGVEVKKDICEHFAYSRQEMYHLAKIGNIRTFEDFIAKHGKG